MDLFFNKKLVQNYHSTSQIIRVLSEDWVTRHIFCPSCGDNHINKYENNKPVADFYCNNCTEDYELKGKKGYIGNKIVNGAYNQMISRLNGNNNPNLFILIYKKIQLSVIDFFVIPKRFFIPLLIEKRHPLSRFAKRANWVGCNILINQIPSAGKIYYVKNCKSLQKIDVINNWRKTLFLEQTYDNNLKGWLLDVMRCIDKLEKKEFILDDIYKYESELKILHPSNFHIKDKIRQQLQLLRDMGYLEFVSSGYYRCL
jgi:type II restriction enzyme